ncbi:hypothetical protein SIID45300_01776 [Candidatus Magnetaquicoccaceae bacterium FCR-1]|uniref:Uncharacterized protein n=1 Tax=Candidatus Magnetaquiglobus chichijimensis TaxID=3141448 RepID=A0ABQ0C992_9PROT
MKAKEMQFILPLLDPPSMERELPGFLDLDSQIRHIIGEMIVSSRKDRYILAAEMTRDTGKDISHHMLYAWTSSKESQRFPLAYLVAFEKACGSYDLLEFLAAKRGCALLIGDQTEAANLGRIQMLKQDLDREEEKIQSRIERKRRLAELQGVR